jgi:three-Cys-motif partner protein
MFYFLRLKYPIWTENKAKLIERYLYYFVLITHHGSYVDGFAGPQKVSKPEMWAAKLALENEPRWLRQFFLFEKRRKQYQYLELLKESQPDIPQRNIRLYKGDFNTLIHNFLAENLIGQREAAFCLLDQRTFECHWSSIKALAEYKKGGMKIELFYFLCSGWLDRAISAVRNKEILISWWGRQNWHELRGMNSSDRANLIAQRFKEEFNYTFADPWPIFQRKGSRKIMYHMIHATDHPEAPNLMYRAYHKAISQKEPFEQLAFEFDQWKAHN